MAKQVKNIETDMLRSVAGSPVYMSPQIIANEHYNYKSDIWALGTLFFELLVGFLPFPAQNKAELRVMQKQGKY